MSALRVARRCEQAETKLLNLKAATMDIAMQC